MISLVVHNKHKRETENIKEIYKELAAKLSDDYWSYESYQDVSELMTYLSDNPLMDMLFYDVASSNTIDNLIKIRKRYKETSLLLLADVTMSPMDYLKPDISPQSLLLRPWTKEQAFRVCREFFENYLEEHRGEDSSNKVFVIDGKDGRITVPYEQILFFEAREKKLFVCLGNDEYGFYGSLDGLEETLPEQFIRCHRSFIVNGKKIRKIKLSQNEIDLVDDFFVPLSRSYKSVLKGWGKND